MVSELKTRAAAAELTPVQKRFLAALSDTWGNVSAACTATGISRATHYNWRKDDVYSEAVEHIEERNLDRAETALQGLIEAGNVTAIIFYLKTKGRKRGYTEKIDVTTDREPVFIFTEIIGSSRTLATDD
jgi:hypothetical protein